MDKELEKQIKDILAGETPGHYVLRRVMDDFKFEHAIILTINDDGNKLHSSIDWEDMLSELRKAIKVIKSHIEGCDDDPVDYDNDNLWPDVNPDDIDDDDDPDDHYTEPVLWDDQHFMTEIDC